MATSILSPGVQQTLKEAQERANQSATKTVSVNGVDRAIPFPFPSPADWRDQWIYFILIDRFNNPFAIPNGIWNEVYDFRQGGTFAGITQQLDYIQTLGAKALWLSPVLKNSKPDWQWNYHGYSIQDFLTVDERFGSDGTSLTAERELLELIDAAHARGLFVILDIVINHATRAFDYVYNGAVTSSFKDEALLSQTLGGEPPIQWLDGAGIPRSDWQDTLPDAATLSPDDAVWPADLQRADFFRRRGVVASDAIGSGTFVKGDFGTMRQLVVEYKANLFPGQQSIREHYGPTPVLSILIQIHQYLIAKFDLDGFRIDTVKYVDPDMVEIFGNAIREYALSIGKKNFFTFGEIYDDENTIARFVGRNSSAAEGYGIDAALDFPLFYKLPGVAKGTIGVEAIRNVFVNRKAAEEGLLSTHGEAGRFFVSFLDNHDIHERFNHPQTPQQQVTLGLAVLFCLQGIPCLYYGTEQGLQGIKDENGASVERKESVREALWGKTPIAFDEGHAIYQQIQLLSRLRSEEAALRYGRLYFRDVSGNGQDFGQAEGAGGIVAFSRILSNKEVVVVANTSFTNPFDGAILVDNNLNRPSMAGKVAYSNLGTTATGNIQVIQHARFHERDKPERVGEATCISVQLAPMEVQVLITS